MTTGTTETETRRDTTVETDLRIPETVPEFLEVTRPPTRRRSMIIGLVVAALLVMATIALFIWQPWDTAGESTYTGDWKDSIAVQPVPDTYTGDWKDSVYVQPVPDTYTGDWKDGIG